LDHAPTRYVSNDEILSIKDKILKGYEQIEQSARWNFANIEGGQFTPVNANKAADSIAEAL
jgi:hypothetical protein